MGTWLVIHYGGPIATGLTKTLCGIDAGEPETWAAARRCVTYRDYELLDSVPENCRPCGACKTALDFWRTRELKARRMEWRATIEAARRKIPLLIERGKWERIEKLAHDAADAKRSLEVER